MGVKVLSLSGEIRSSDEGYVSAFECSLGSSCELDLRSCLVTPEPTPMRQRHVAKRYFQEFPNCIENHAAYLAAVEKLDGYDCTINIWPDYVTLTKQCSEIEKLLAPCKHFATATRGDQHVFFQKEIAEFQYNHLPGKKVAGSYVWLEGVLWIMCQRPKQSRCEKFMESVAEHDSHVICLASTNDAPLEKQCERYWGDAKEEIIKIGSSLQRGLAQRLVKRQLKDANGKEFTQLHLDYWFDHGCSPDLDVLLAAFEELDKIQSQGPLHVHCAAGINRSGAFIVLFTIWRLLKENPQSVINVPTMIFQMQWQRQSACYSALQWFHELIPQMAEKIKANQP